MDNQRVLKKAPSYRFAVFILLLFPYILVYAGIQIIASLGGEIMEAQHLGESGLSFLSSLGLLTKAGFALLSGVLVGKYGGKKVLIMGLAIIAFSGLMFLLVGSSFALLCIVRLIQGIGSGILSGCLLALLAKWYPKKERGTAQGAMCCFYGGGLAIATVYAFFCTSEGLMWNQTVGYMLLATGGIMAVLIAFFYRDVDKVYGVSIIDDAIITQENVLRDESRADEGNKPSSWGEMLHYPGFWITASMVLFYGAACSGISFIMPIYLKDCGYPEAQQTSIMTIGTISSVATSLIGGIVSDKVFSSRRSETVIIGFGVFSILFVGIVIWGRQMSAVWLTVAYFVSYGMMMLGSAPEWVLPVEITSPNFSTQCLGACIMFSGVGGFSATYLMGYVAERWNVELSLCIVIICSLLVVAGGWELKKLYKA